MFSTKGNQIISSLCCLLGYYLDEWVDELILGFMSIFSTKEKSTTQFKFNQFLADNIQNLFKFPMEGMFQYSSILSYMFLFFQSKKFSFLLQKLDIEGSP